MANIIGTAPNQVPTNADLGTMAFQDHAAVNIQGGAVNATLGAITPAPVSATTLNTTGNATFGDASTDTVTVNGYMGVGGAGSAGHGIYFNSVPNTSTFASAITTNFIFPATTTSYAASFQSNISAVAGSYTTPNVYGFIAGNMGAVGAGATVTNLHGFYVADQTRGTNNYGITSLVSSGTNKFNIYASGTAVNYFAGNVGIGTTTPSAKIDVASASGNTAIIARSITATNASVQLAGNGNTPGTSSFDLIQDNTYAYIYQRDSKPLVFATSNTERMRLDASGNLGIGTTSPLTIMHASAPVSVGAVVNVGMFGQNSGSNPTVGQGARITLSSTNNAGRCAAIQGVHESGTNAHYMAFLTSANGVDPAERMRIDSAGNTQVLTGATVVYAPAPVTISTTATLNGASILAQIINTTGTTYTVTMVLGTTLEGLVPWAAVNLGYDFTVINTASGTITMAANTGVTTLGTLTIATGVSAQFRIRRTAANTFIMYRLS